MISLMVNAPNYSFGGFSWYDFGGDTGPGSLRSRRLRFEVLDTQRAKGFPTEQTVLFGFSQGCLMIVDAGFRYPHCFAGLVGISGYVFEPETLVAELSPVAVRQSMFFTHGTQESRIAFAAVVEQSDIVNAAG